MANELSYSSDDLYGQYGYEGGQNVTFSALDAIISNLKVSSAQIENLAVTDAHIKELNAAKLKAGSIIAGDITFTGVLSGASGTFSGDLTGSHGNFEEVRVSQEFGGLIKIGTGTLNAGGSTWTPTGDVILSSDLYNRAVKLSHEDAGTFDFNIQGNLDAYSMTVYGTPVLYGTHGIATATQSASTRLTVTVTHNLPTIHDVQLTVQWSSGSVSLDSVKEVYVENITGTTFDIKVSGTDFVAGNFLNVMWVAFPQ